MKETGQVTSPSAWSKDFAGGMGGGLGYWGNNSPAVGTGRGWALGFDNQGIEMAQKPASYS